MKNIYFNLEPDSKYNNKSIMLAFPITITCIDDSNKPISIVPENWIIEGEKYTCIEIEKNLVTLEEVSPDHPLFKGYKADRFMITDEDIDLNNHFRLLMENYNKN